jgi:hypothetical protein
MWRIYSKPDSHGEKNVFIIRSTACFKCIYSVTLVLVFSAFKKKYVLLRTDKMMYLKFVLLPYSAKICKNVYLPWKGLKDLGAEHNTKFCSLSLVMVKFSYE